MNFYLLVCRSLTYAQRTVKALERAGVSAAVVRRSGTDGCGYCVKIREKYVKNALTVLRDGELSPRKIMRLLPNGEVEETAL